MKGVGHAPGGPLWDPWSMSLNATHHKEQEYIWFMGADLNGFRDKYISILWKGGGACPRGTPRGSKIHVTKCALSKGTRIYGLWVGIWRFPRYQAFCEMKGVGHTPRRHPGVPRSMSLNAPYLKEQEYIRFMDGDLSGFQDIMHFMKWRGWGMPLGSQDQCHLMCLIIRNKNIYGLGRVFWTISKLCIFTFSHTNAYATKFDLGLK